MSLSACNVHASWRLTTAFLLSPDVGSGLLALLAAATPQQHAFPLARRNSAAMSPDHGLFQRYLRGEGDLEAVARALSREDGMYSFGTAKDPPYTAEEQAVLDRAVALFTRIEAIRTAERLIGYPTATPVRIDAWDPPDDPESFCLSIEVILRGRDAEGEHTLPMRAYACTPTWLAERARERGGWMWSSAPLVVTAWRPRQIREAIERLADAGGYNTWAQFVEHMGRYLEPEG